MSISKHNVGETIAATYDEKVPGTVHLADLDGTILAKHAGSTDIILIPAPFSDPEDPLNWSRGRKNLSTACVLLYTALVASAFGATPTVIAPISADTGLTANDLSVGFGYAFLGFGWGCLVFQPLAIQYGKRPMFLVSIAGTVAVMVWTAYCRDSGNWIARSVLQGFFGAPVESLAEVALTDIYFQHERGTFIAYYGMFLFGGIYVMTIIAGFISDGQGWQWVMYWSGIFNAVGVVVLVFFMEETNYSRQLPSEAVVDERANDMQTSQPPRTFLQKMRLWRSADLHKPNHLLGMVIRPLIFLSWPVVFYCGFSYGGSIIWFNVLINTASPILSSPPYNFSTALVGLSYLAVLIGTILAFFLCGPLGDIFSLRMARRNGGISEPEHRLWLNIVPLVLIPSSLILWGVGSAQGIHWFGCIVALFFLGVGLTFMLQINITYCLESYKDLGAEVLVTVIIIRNTMNFGFNYGFTPWLDGMGRQNTFITAAFVGLAQIATFLIMIKYGKSLRKASARRYVKYAKRMAVAGMVG